MTQHPPQMPVITALNELNGHILDVIMKYDLTTMEEIAVVGGALSGHLNTIAKYGIREERHGNQETPGSWAADEDDEDEDEEDNNE